MAILGRQQTILIDCSNNPFVRLEQAGIHYGEISDVILTHFHPDHVSGVALVAAGYVADGQENAAEDLRFGVHARAHGKADGSL